MLQFEIYILAVQSYLSERIKSFRVGGKFINITGNSVNFELASQFLMNNDPDILLIDDLFFDKTELIDFIDNFPKSFPSTKIIIYTCSNNADYLKTCVNKGVNGIIHKKSAKKKIIAAIKLVGTGGAYFDSLVKNLIDEHILIGELCKNVEQLTKREKEVLTLISEGLENKAISNKLFISIKTVEFHKENIKLKLGVKTVKNLYNLNLDKMVH